jgi:sec-independent protein translocase protein TatC
LFEGSTAVTINNIITETGRLNTPNMEEKSPKMTFLSHFKELRNRLLVSVVSLAVTTFASFTFSQTLAEFLAKPIGGISKLSAIDVTENVSAFMKISLLSGVTLALPIIVFEILAFVMPGLKRSERFWIWLALPTATVFFIGGVAFAYFFMLPTALPFLLNFMGINTSPRPNNYFGFVTNLLFWVGVSFELPLVMFVLAKLKIVSAKQLVRQWRIAIVISAVLAALITPTPDPVNMGLMMIPLIGLYFLSIIFAIFARMEKKPKIKKKLSKAKRILLIISIVVIIIGIVVTILLWPQEIKTTFLVCISFVEDVWKNVLGFFQEAGQKIHVFISTEK